jgi:hypothetical protein
MITIYGIEAIQDKARELLQQTDYAVLPDVNLFNKQEFTDFRQQVRSVFITPVDEFTFPDVPVAIWYTS